MANEERSLRQIIDQACNDDPHFREYLEHGRTDMLPKVKESVWVMSIQADKPDIKQCLEIGAAVLYDKPVIIVARPDQKIPVNIRRLATVILQGDLDDNEFRKRIAAALKRIVNNDQRVKKFLKLAKDAVDMK